LPQRNQAVEDLARRSYLLDFLYWRLYRLAIDDSAHWDYIYAAFSDERVLDDHLSQLDSVIHFAEVHGAELHVVVFPHLADVERTKEFTDRVVRFLGDRKVSVIDLGTRLLGREPASLMAGPQDAHPNEELHLEVAELLLERMGRGWR
jgi:hypothetical protein